MIYGKDVYKNRILFLLFFIFLFFSKLYALEENDVFQLIKERGIKNYQNLSKIFSINDELSLVLFKYNDENEKSFRIFIVSEKTFDNIDIFSSSLKEYLYLNKCNEADICYGDFNFDGEADIFFIRGADGPVIEINSLNLDNKENYFSIYFPPYSYYLNSNKRISKLDYISFDDFDFCIVNNRRGIRVYSMGEIQYKTMTRNKTKYDIYNVILENSTESYYLFFYWNPIKHKYILDETVTQEQLKNAYCPEDYFAYNGLKFSKLDSKLTEADLKDLDKAQLRLMRNAVYARHGRTFKSVDLQSLWECYTWYKKNPNYSDSLLTDIDKYNIKLIQKYEAK
ncbi:MAG: YARHG domain-containing protein [Treponema sp.]|nr:YARHG domain-containing protein [Treponema sp.]